MALPIQTYWDLSSWIASAPIRTCNLSEEWVTGGWISLTFLAMLVVLLFLSITYMASVVLKRVDWLVWAKEEFYQIIISSVLIIVVIWFAWTACSVSVNLAGTDPFRAADTYLNDLIWQKSIRIATNLYIGSVFAQITAVWYIPMGHLKSGMHPFAGMNALSGVLDLMFGITSMLFASLLMQVIILWLIQAFAFKILLPFGLLFRVFPFLRSAGATFIGLALAFYIIFPLAYVMDKNIMEQVTGNKIDYKNSPDQSMWSNDANFSFLNSLWAPGMIEDVANLIPAAVFFPMLNILITIAFARTATKILSQSFPSPFE